MTFTTVLVFRFSTVTCKPPGLIVVPVALIALGMERHEIERHRHVSLTELASAESTTIEMAINEFQVSM